MRYSRQNRIALSQGQARRDNSEHPDYWDSPYEDDEPEETEEDEIEEAISERDRRDIAADFAYDCAREDRIFGRNR
jgi:hypothetical protein